MTRLPGALFALSLLFVAVGLGFAVMQMPPASGDLVALVDQHMADAGVGHPVTAVLLNYRAYDTLLEMVVLLLALFGAWGLNDSAEVTSLPSAPPVLEQLVRLLVPVLIVVAAYLLWVGAYSPGGAFQAGAVLAGAGVLMSLLDPAWRGARMNSVLELVLLPGILVFTIVGVAGMLVGGRFLEYPAGAAGTLILVIEGFATLSIAVTLQTLFAGAARAGAARAGVARAGAGPGNAAA